MVGRWRAAREDPLLAARALLALRGIERPTELQQVGALLEAEYMLKFIHRRGL